MSLNTVQDLRNISQDESLARGAFCFFCGKLFDEHEYFLGWMGSAEPSPPSSLARFIYWHPACWFDMSIRLGRDLYELKTFGFLPDLRKVEP